jgi:aryl-alcohol dehydrogenase-like predicted oxidoreductase
LRILNTLKSTLLSKTRCFFISNKYNISCITSAPYGQGQIKNINFPDLISDNFYGTNNFQKALSFCLSAPYIQSVIIGTLNLSHLNQAVEVLNYNGHSVDVFYKVFKS